MFETIKYFVEQKVGRDEVVADLLRFGYKRSHIAVEEGFFSVKGSTLDVFPLHFDAPVRLDLDEDQLKSIYSIDIITGKNIWTHKAVIIFSKKLPQRKEPFNSEMPLNCFVDIERGDYVVHHRHGIGKYLGLKEFDIDLKKIEHFVIEYQAGEKLYVPRHDMHLIQKYVGFTKKPPRLFKLGSKEWEKMRRMVEKRIQCMAAELLHVQAMRETLVGTSFSKDSIWQKDFEKAFPFIETPDQIRSTYEVKQDMESFKPMDRLLCGDVGYGKTEVAMRAAFKAVMEGKQVAVLVPTTVLAEQHYYHFSKRMKDFPIRIGMLSRFRTKKEQKDVIADTIKGQVDILIGTHRILSKDVSFKDLGLIVIDEEQRFGVNAKESLKHMKLLADVLTLTATPIPRTLFMAMSGCRDMSVISTPPQNRVPVTTKVLHFDEDFIQEAIKKELSRKGQVFFLHNHVDDISLIANIVKRLVPYARIGIGHGQMPSRMLEDVMLKFLKGEIDVLICTTIIESGIDIPNANTLIVNQADRFGLSDLHQLRGRVGRMDVKAYAYFLIDQSLNISGVPKRRLEVLEKFTDLGAGFHIAFEDLQIRGAGNILGKQQHGCIASVGFDLYCRMLKESIEHIKKESEKSI